MIFSSTNRKAIIGASILNEGSDAALYAFVFFVHAKSELLVLGQFAFIMAIINFAKFFDFGIVNSLSSIIANNKTNQICLPKILFLATAISNIMYSIMLTAIIIIIVSIYNLSAKEFGYAFILALLTLNISLISAVFDGFKLSVLKNIVSMSAVIICIPVTLVISFQDPISQILFCFILVAYSKLSFLIYAYYRKGLMRPLVCYDLMLVKEFINLTVSVQITSLLSAFLNPFLKIVIGPSNYAMLGAIELSLQIVMRFRKFLNAYTRTFIPYMMELNDYKKIQTLNFKISFICLSLILLFQIFFIDHYKSYVQNIHVMQIIICAWLYNINSIAPFYQNIAFLRPKYNLIAYALIFMIFAIPSFGHITNIWTIEEELLILIYSGAILIGSAYLVLRRTMNDVLLSMLKRELMLIFIVLYIFYVNI